MMSENELERAVKIWRKINVPIGCLDVYLRAEHGATSDDIVSAMRINATISDATYMRRIHQ